MSTRRMLANAIRMLAIDAIQKANSGHPGMPMGMADIAEVLWRDFLHYAPSNPEWPNRDRFVLSNGHGSMLQYALLHLTGYDVSLDDLKSFRQLHSRTPGHPEVGMTPGIETTTGPLGQGLANAVGMALAEKILAAQFNRPGFNIIDHYTYVFAGDGCLMEGISHEVCSLAGTWELGKLIIFWDDNHISIDGDVAGWFTDDTPKRFEAYGWQVISGVDGHDAEAIDLAIRKARAEKKKPTLICCRTMIGFGSPNKAGKASCHGSPLGEEEVALVRKQFDWPYAPFEIPKEIYDEFNSVERGKILERAWELLFEKYEQKHADLARELKRRLAGDLPDDWSNVTTQLLQNLHAKEEPMATRKAAEKVLENLGSHLPEFLGGSADLTESCLSKWSGSRELTNKNTDANYIHYGVREFGMSAIMNGVALHGGFIPYGSTFLVFYTYAANAVRMAALMKKRVVFVYTHDSIGLGEDGPTHQPIEQLAALRAIPNLSVWRPADLTESFVAWQYAIEQKHGPTALILSRQKVKTAKKDVQTLNKIKHGGYTLIDCNGTPDSIIIATGSELYLAVEAANALSQKGHKIRVVSMPSVDVFLKQSANYQESVIPVHVTRRVVVEMGSPASWGWLTGTTGRVIGISTFGESGKEKDLYEHFGFTVQNIVNVIETMK